MVETFNREVRDKPPKPAAKASARGIEDMTRRGVATPVKVRFFRLLLPSLLEPSQCRFNTLQHELADSDAHSDLSKSPDITTDENVFQIGRTTSGKKRATLVLPSAGSQQRRVSQSDEDDADTDESIAASSSASANRSSRTTRQLSNTSALQPPANPAAANEDDDHNVRRHLDFNDEVT